jgi:hypothetical protein
VRVKSTVLYCVYVVVVVSYFCFLLFSLSTLSMLSVLIRSMSTPNKTPNKTPNILYIYDQRGTLWPGRSPVSIK